MTATVRRLVALGWTMVALAQVARMPRRAAVEIDVTAHQWWWQAEYPDQQVVTANADSNSNAYSHSNSDVRTNPCAAGCHRRNGCDHEQLHRPMEQCKRCRRLQVGRVDEAIIQPLLTRLPRFGRRQHYDSRCHRIER